MRIAYAQQLVVLGLLGACGQDIPVAPTEVAFTKVPEAQTGGRPLHAQLGPTGSPPLAPEGIGTALITLNYGRSEICWDVTASNITLPSGTAHIHGPLPSVAVVLPFPGPDATGISVGCAGDIDRALIKDILQNPGSYLVNLHPAPGLTEITGILSK